ncbi:MAG: hypothetical protein ACPLRN_01795 [Microgenomates group bacterium]
MNKFKIKIFFGIFISLILVNILISGEKELTPKILAQKIVNFLPKKLQSLVYEKKKSPIYSKVVLSKEKLEKIKLNYNNEEFEVYIDPNIELSQEKVKMLYLYWKLVNKK